MTRKFLFAIAFIVLTGVLYLNFRTGIITGHSNVNGHEVGDAIDSLDGVLVYYNGNVSHTAGRNLSSDGYNIGLKYQCVEFAKRYYFEHYKHRMPDSYGHAKDFFKKGLASGKRNTARNLFQFTNGSSTTPPLRGDLIVWDGNIYNPYGHIAVISAVSDRSVEIIQQNPGPNAPSRIQAELLQSDGMWKINLSEVLGWLGKRNS
jgi:hypothetical protein